MTEPDPFHKYGELAAGHALPTTIHPTISAPAALTTPTEMMTVDGVQVAVSDRLLKLAAIRDQHRATLRAVGDRRRALQDQADDLTRRMRRIEQSRFSGTPSATAEAEAQQLRSDLEQVRAASRALDAEDAAATAAYGDAGRLLRAAIAFAKEKGAILPITLAGER